MDEEDSEVEHNVINLMTRTVDCSKVDLTSEAESEAELLSEDKPDPDQENEGVPWNKLFYFADILFRVRKTSVMTSGRV
jgi:hypothetical protein